MSIIEKLVKQESGRIFNTAGDSFMVEFNSTYNAVSAAIKIQKELHQINNKLDVFVISMLLSSLQYALKK